MSQLGVAPSGERLRKKAIYGVICTEVGLGPGDIVLDADPAPAQKGTAPQFSAHVYCGQTAGWTKMSLSMEASLGSGDFVFDGDPAPLPKKGHSPTPIFGSCLLWPNGWMDQDATWYGGKPRPRRRCVRRGPSSLAASVLFSAHVYCGHGRPSQLYC